MQKIIRGGKAVSAALAASASLALAGCSVNRDTEETLEAGDPAEDEAAAVEASETGLPQPSPTEPVEMAETAWAANDPDGVVYTTFIDADGTYRDFRSGRRYQIGGWEMPDPNQICYRPDNAPIPAADSEVGPKCWIVRPPDDEGVMIARDSEGREVTIRRVEYVPPAPLRR